jgi:hypothetical protein
LAESDVGLSDIGILLKELGKALRKLAHLHQAYDTRSG